HFVHDVFSRPLPCCSVIGIVKTFVPRGGTHLISGNSIRIQIGFLSFVGSKLCSFVKIFRHDWLVFHRSSMELPVFIVSCKLHNATFLVSSKLNRLSLKSL